MSTVAAGERPAVTALHGLAVIGVSAVLLAVFLGYCVAAAKVRRYGFLMILGRWLTGAAIHGKPITDAGWFRPGKKALTRTGHATRWWYLPRWQRAAWHSGGLLGAVVAVYGLAVARPVALAALAAAGVAGAAYGVLVAVRGVRGRRHRRTWLEPLHGAVAPLVGWPLPNAPKSWIEVEPDRSRAVLQLPPGFNTAEKERAAIAGMAAAKLGIEAPEVAWALAGPTPTLTLTASAPPPARVTLDDVADAIAQARVDELVLGLDKHRRPVVESLHGDSPHVGLSIASGGGKSTAARLAAAQILHRGGVTAILDPKWISHTWARGLPNVAYAKTAAQCHQLLLWLLAELDRRNEVADAGVDVEGDVTGANVGPTLLVVVEEMNMLTQRLKQHWRSIRVPGDPARSPAQEALDQLLFAGRQARLHVLAIGQRLSAAASGSGDARENLACRVLGRYTAGTWKMLCPEHAMPAPDRHPGRVQVVDHRVRATQIAELTGKQARAYAMSGKVTPAPPGMPFVTAAAPVGIIGDTAPPVPAGPVAELTAFDGAADLSVVDAYPADPISLREAVLAGIVGPSVDAVKKARHRGRDSFPPVIARRGPTELFDATALADWQAARRS